MVLNVNPGYSRKKINVNVAHLLSVKIRSCRPESLKKIIIKVKLWILKTTTKVIM